MRGIAQILVLLASATALALAGRPPTVLLLVLSDCRPASADDRQLTRQGWLALLPPHWDISFIVGQPLAGACSALVEPDVVQVAAPDDYRGLTRKLLAAFTHAAAARDVDGDPYQFIVKTDHDVHVNVPELLHFLEQLPGQLLPQDLGVAGFVTHGGFPARTRHDKNADVSLPMAFVPPYPSGVLYVLPQASVVAITQLPSPIIAFNEDVAVGLWLAQVSGARANAGSHQSGPTLPKYVHHAGAQAWTTCCPGQLVIHGLSHVTRSTLADQPSAGWCSLVSGEVGCCGCCLGCPSKQNTTGQWYVCGRDGVHVPGALSVVELTRAEPWRHTVPRSPEQVRRHFSEFVRSAYSNRGQTASPMVEFTGLQSALQPVRPRYGWAWQGSAVAVSPMKNGGTDTCGGGTFAVLSADVVAHSVVPSWQATVVDAVSSAAGRLLSKIGLPQPHVLELGPHNTIARLRLGRLHELFGFKLEAIHVNGTQLPVHIVPLAHNATYVHHEAVFLPVCLKDVANVSLTAMGVPHAQVANVINDLQLLLLELPPDLWPERVMWARHREEAELRPGYGWLLRTHGQVQADNDL